jgi:hypothetical protein
MIGIKDCKTNHVSGKQLCKRALSKVESNDKMSNGDISAGNSESSQWVCLQV